MISYRNLIDTLRRALTEDKFDGHIDKEELSDTTLKLLLKIARQDKDGVIIYADDFKALIEQLRQQAGEEESPQVQAIIDEIGPDNYQMLLEDSINYIIIHGKDDAKASDIKTDCQQQVEDPDEVFENPEQVIGESLNEIAIERYLRVEPVDKKKWPDAKEDARVVLYQGDQIKDAYAFDLEDGMDDMDIIAIAKDNFDNITDDIRVVWY